MEAKEASRVSIWQAAVSIKTIVRIRSSAPPACGTREATGNMQIQPHQHQQVQPQRKRGLGQMPYKRPSVVCVAMILEMHCSARTARSNEALREYPRQSDRGWASLFPCTHLYDRKPLVLPTTRQTIGWRTAARKRLTGQSWRRAELEK